MRLTSMVVVVSAGLNSARTRRRSIAVIFIHSKAGFIHSNSDADRATAGSTSLYLFDAVPFWLIPPFVAPGPFLAAAAE